MKLFLKYIWSDTVFPWLIPPVITMLISMPYLIQLNMPWPWLFVSVITLVSGAIALAIMFVITVGLHLIKAMHEQLVTGFIAWKNEQHLPPSNNQVELEKVIQILNQYELEVNIRKHNSSAAKLYKEYQCVLTLADGVKTYNDIELTYRWKHCIKNKSDLQ